MKNLTRNFSSFWSAALYWILVNTVACYSVGGNWTTYTPINETDYLNVLKNSTSNFNTTNMLTGRTTNLILDPDNVTMPSNFVTNVLDTDNSSMSPSSQSVSVHSNNNDVNSHVTMAMSQYTNMHSNVAKISSSSSKKDTSLKKSLSTSTMSSIFLIPTLSGKKTETKSSTELEISSDQKMQTSPTKQTMVSAVTTFNNRQNLTKMKSTSKMQAMTSPVTTSGESDKNNTEMDSTPTIQTLLPPTTYVGKDKNDTYASNNETLTAEELAEGNLTRIANFLGIFGTVIKVSKTNPTTGKSLNDLTTARLNTDSTTTGDSSISSSHFTEVSTKLADITRVAMETQTVTYPVTTTGTPKISSTTPETQTHTTTILSSSKSTEMERPSTTTTEYISTGTTHLSSTEMILSTQSENLSKDSDQNNTKMENVTKYMGQSDIKPENVTEKFGENNTNLDNSTQEFGENITKSENSTQEFTLNNTDSSTENYPDTHTNVTDGRETAMTQTTGNEETTVVPLENTTDDTVVQIRRQVGDEGDDTYWPIAIALTVGLPVIIVFGVMITVLNRKRGKKLTSKTWNLPYEQMMEPRNPLSRNLEKAHNAALSGYITPPTEYDA